MRAAGDVASGAVFCGNPQCVLHVRAGGPAVRGAGEWAVRPDGVVTSRRTAAGRMLCDVCARALEERPAGHSGERCDWAEEGG